MGPIDTSVSTKTQTTLKSKITILIILPALIKLIMTNLSSFADTNNSAEKINDY
jgi:hypothetical protein